MKFTLLPFAALLCFFTSNAQNLPNEMYFSPDNKIIYTGGRPSYGFYDATLVKSIYLNFPQSNYWSQLQSNYSSKTELPATLTVDGFSFDSVGVRFKGQTSYSGSGSSQKKSFNITMDAFKDGMDLYGYNITNLNNCFQDPSFLREVFYLNQIKRHIPVAKACFVKLYINGANWGVYPNVQQLNKDFLKEWFLNNNGTNWRADRPSGGGGGGGWGDGTAALNYLSNDTTPYKTYYTLKSTDVQNPWTDLVNVCRVLDTVSNANMESVLSNYLDIDRTLWFLGSEIAFADDDGYAYKGKMDYYVYQDVATGRMAPIEYDGNSVMEASPTNWSPFYNASNANYPLLNRMLAVPAIRQRYLAHFRTIIKDELDSLSAIQNMTYFHNLIDTMVQNDPKKLYSYTQFGSEFTDIKNWIHSRRNYLNSNTEVNRVSPTISNVNYLSAAGLWMEPAANEDVAVFASASAQAGIQAMNLYYGTGLQGKFSKVSMFDDGLHNDSAAGDGIYGGTIPGQSSGQWVRFYVEAVSADAWNTVSYSPAGAEHDIYIYKVVPSIATNIPVVINEVMASNSVTAADSAGEYDDWIEIYNLTSQPQDISGYYLTENPLNLTKWEFPAGTIIAPNGYLIVWADEDGSQGSLHANFKLSGSGEHLILLNSALEIVDEVTFGTQTLDMGLARVPNGSGPFVIQSPTFNASNDLSTDVSEANRAITGITAYPNPANNYLRVYLSKSAGNALEIYNSLGGLIVKEEFRESYDINTSSWADGMYFIRSGNSLSKIVIRH